MGGKYRCVACGQQFKAVATVERHCDAMRHHRYEITVGRYWPTEKAKALLHPEEAAK